MPEITNISTDLLVEGVASIIRKANAGLQIQSFKDMKIKIFGNAVFLKATGMDNTVIETTGLISPKTGGLLTYLEENPTSTVISLHEYGCTQKEIADFMDMSQSRVSIILAKGKKDG